MSDMRAAEILGNVRSCRNNHNCDMDCEKCQFNYSVSELNEAICAAVETLVERGKE